MVIYCKNKDFSNIIENKKIALIGPSKHLEGKKCGKKFEQYDLICRVNEFHPFGYEEDYGNRTDIVFHNINNKAAVVFAEELEFDRVMTSKLRFVICPQASHDDTGLDIVKNFSKINIHNIPFHHIGDEYYSFMRRIIGTKPNTGLMAMIVLLNYHIKELLLSGFSFYSQGPLVSQCHRSGYPNTYSIYTTGHRQEPQIAFFKNIIMKKYGNIIRIDDFLNNLLQLKHYNVLGLE